jgi:hypothetical protein
MPLASENTGVNSIAIGHHPCHPVIYVNGPQLAENAKVPCKSRFPGITWSAQRFENEQDAVM